MSTSLDGTAVKNVADLAQQALAAEPRIVEIDGLTFSTTTLQYVAPPKDPAPAALTVHTLTGLTDYIEANRDTLPLNECVLHVVNPGRVELRGRLTGHHQQRHTYIVAEHFDRFAAFQQFRFGAFASTEVVIIATQALFEDAADRAGLVQLLGGVKSINEAEFMDDGVSQQVEVRKGAVLTRTTVAPTRLALVPFRTFPEVAQPESNFFLRLKEQGDGMAAALFEADGGAWQLEAIGNIDTWLSDRLKDAGVEDLAVIA
ncbi:hypothetical protein [Longimicrobium sp.]|jgi:hypothetical protein|uniref:hypothetical protein n=1 Tax=Longimicrobium sp. TaxID=2029185 RepID=UPI002F954CE1